MGDMVDEKVCRCIATSSTRQTPIEEYCHVKWFHKHMVGSTHSCLKVLGIICCMAGNAATLLGSDKPDQKGQFSGDLLCIVAAMLYAAYTTVLSRIVQPDFSMAILFGVIGVAILVIGAPLVFSLKQEALRRMTPEIFGLLIFNGIFDNVLSQFCWAKAVQWTSPTTATVGLSLTIPLSILADLVRQKHLTPWTYLAALLVLSGFVAVTLASRPRAAESSALREDCEITGSQNI